MTDTTKYGPQTAEVVALLARGRALSDIETRMLSAEWGVTRGEAWYTAWDAVLGARWGDERYAAWNAVRRDAWDGARGWAWYPVRGAARALVARDLITPAGFTQAHYDLLTGPWRRVVGAVHPDDKEMK